MPRRDLGAAVVRFGTMLRQQGLPITPIQVTDAARALELLDVSDRAELHLGLRAVFVARPEDFPAFDRCFEWFWRLQGDDDGQALPGLLSMSPPASDQDGSSGSDGAARQESPSLDAWGDDPEDDGDEPLGVPGVSDREAVMTQDFSTFSAEQLDEVFRLTVLIAKRLARRISRRRRPVRRKGRVDLRRTLRANLTKGEILELRFRARRRRKVRLVLLCDVSGSMDLYSRFLLQFLFALQSVFGRVETFAFSTRLTRITEHLKARSYRQVLRRLAEVRDWAGGTRIGESLAQFNREWPMLVDRRTIVIVLSDGWDTGDPEVLASELLRIKRRAARVIWLNPLLGNPSYEPLTRGMVAALPLVDQFAAAHNLASLRALAGHLVV